MVLSFSLAVRWTVPGPATDATPKPRRVEVSAIAADATTIVAIWMIGSLLMVPLVGATIRYAVMPLLGAMAAYRAGERPGRGLSELSELSERVAAAERRIGELERLERTSVAGSGAPYG
jgi:hypothetical protein